MPEISPTICNIPYTTHVDAGSENGVEIIVWDTPGLGLDQSLEQSISMIPSVQCVLLCYAVNDPDHLMNVEEFVSLPAPAFHL